jgi:hypothetical protein
VRKCATVIAALVALAPAVGHAEEAGIFECYIAGHPPPEPDPIVRIDVHIDGAKGLFDVAHHSLRGITYVRDEQYQKTIPFQTENGKDIWVGVLKRSPAIVMRGAFSWNDARNSFQYEEEVYNRSSGTKDMVTWSLCFPSQQASQMEQGVDSDSAGTGNISQSLLNDTIGRWAIGDPAECAVPNKSYVLSIDGQQAIWRNGDGETFIEAIIFSGANEFVTMTLKTNASVSRGAVPGTNSRTQRK